MKEGNRVFIAEDEAMVRNLLEDMLADLGHDVRVSAVNIGEAMEVAGTNDFEVAILDIHLNGQPIYPAADILIQRGIPFIFATGGVPDDMPDRFKSAPRVQKPFVEHQLQEALDRVLGG